MSTIFRGGWWHQPPLENHFWGQLVMPPAPEKHHKYLGASHLPPPDRTVLSGGRCCPKIPYIINIFIIDQKILNSALAGQVKIGGKDKFK